MQLRYTLLACAAATLAGCSTPQLTIGQMKDTTSERAKSAIAEFDKAGRQPAAVREISQPLVDFKRTAAPRIKGDVNLQAASAPFAPIISELGKKAGYSVAYAESVDTGRRVTINFNGAVTEDAIRTTAFLAGYVAVIDKANRTVMVSDEATYTFRVPAGVFSALQAQYTVGGNPANASSGGGGQGGGSAGGSSLKADFNIKGEEGINPESITRYLENIAGKNAQVYVAEGGHVSVRANAQALRRVHEFMKSYVRDAMTQVEIEASVVEVGLNKEFAMGIQWGRVLENASQGAMIGGGAGNALAGAVTGEGPGALLQQMVGASNGGFSAFRVGVNTSSLITALSKFTDVNIVSQPKLVSLNNTPATFFEGTQVPYLGSVEQSQSTTNGSAPTVTGSVAFAIDGVSFSAIPSVIDSSNVQITLIPVLSNVNNFQSFLNNTLTAPNQSNKQTYMRVMAESGKTLILGGIRYNKASRDTNLPSSTSSSSSTKEVVILLRANVITAPTFDPIVSESL